MNATVGRSFLAQVGAGAKSVAPNQERGIALSVRENLLQDRKRATRFAIALFVASYLLLTARSMLDPSQMSDALSVKRLLAILVGVSLFAVLTREHNLTQPQRFREHLPKFLAFFSFSFLAILMVRVAYDLILSVQNETFLQDNLRWLIAWSGYFVAAVFGYYAVTFAARLARTRGGRTRLTDKELRDLVAIRAAAWNPSDRLALAEKLRKVQVYEDADPIVVKAQPE